MRKKQKKSLKRLNHTNTDEEKKNHNIIKPKKKQMRLIRF